MKGQASTRSALLLLTLLLWACQPQPRKALPAVSAPPPGPPATLSVEILGAPGATANNSRANGQVFVLLDLTQSMRVPDVAGVSRDTLARRAAADFLRALPANQPTEVATMGTRGEYGGCTAPESLRGAANRSELASQVESAGTEGEASEGSLTLAIDDARRRLAADRESAAGSPRLVVFSDLASDCGGNWCEAVTRAAGDGIAVEIVELGPARSESCVAALRVPDAEPVRRESPDPDRHPVFQVRRANPDGRPGEILVNGRAGTADVTVPAGRIVVAIELEPAEWVGPLELRAGSRTRIRVLDFVRSNPPWREIFIEPGAADNARVREEGQWPLATNP